MQYHPPSRHALLTLRFTRSAQVMHNSVLLLSTILLVCATAAASGAATPTLTITPAVGAPTSPVLVSGSGFDPYSSVAIYFDAARLAQVTASGTGTFGGGSSYGAMIHVPAAALPGTHFVMAVELSGQKLARKPFLVRTDWAQFHFGPEHAGLNPYENVLGPSNVANLALQWSYLTGGTVGSPVVANGVVYASSTDKNLYALDANTGALLWKYTMDAGAGSPAVSNGLVYVAAGCTLYALNAASGALLWKYQNAGTEPTAANGAVYLGTCDGKVQALNAATGALLWSYPMAIGSTPAVAYGLVLFGATDPNNWDQGTFFAVDAGTGRLVWSRFIANSQNGNVGFSTPAISSYNSVYVSFTTSQQQQYLYGNLVCLGLGGGIQWFAALGGAPASAPALASPMVYAGGSSMHSPQQDLPASLYAYHMGSGQLIWQYLPNATPGAAAVANGVVYFGAGSNLYAVDAETGMVLWQYPAAVQSPVVVNGVVYAGSYDGKIYAFHLTSASH